MSISNPDKTMDDYARDCVVRLANRVDDKVLRVAREWKAAAMDEEIYHRQQLSPSRRLNR